MVGRPQCPTGRTAERYHGGKDRCPPSAIIFLPQPYVPRIVEAGSARVSFRSGWRNSPVTARGAPKLATSCDRQQRAMEQIEKPLSEAPPRPASIGMAGRLQLECPADIMGIRSPEAVWVVLRLELQGLRFSTRERFGRRGGLTPQNRCRNVVFERIIRGDYRVTSWSLRE